MNPIRRLSFKGQIVSATVALVAVAMIVLTTLVQSVLAVVVQSDVTTTMNNRANVVVNAIKVSHDDNAIEVPDNVLDVGVAVYDSSGALLEGALSKHLSATGVEMAERGAPGTIDEDGHRLLAQPFTKSGQSGTVVLTVDLDPYERAELYALLACIALGLVVTAAAAWIARWITRKALQPVTDMARTAEEWSEHTSDQRFALGRPTNELSQLGATLDRLLDRVATALHSEQRLTAELAHELRTPLTGILGSAELALMRPGLTPEVESKLHSIVDSSRRMSATISGLLDIARGEASRTASCTVAEVLNGLGEHRPREVDGDGQVRIGAPVEVVLRALQPLLDNAHRHSKSRVQLSFAAEADRVMVRIKDDGLGVPLEQRATIFEPGHSASGGTGLGLGIARRAARSVGGEITVADGPGGHFVVRLPRR